MSIRQTERRPSQPFRMAAQEPLEPGQCQHLAGALAGLVAELVGQSFIAMSLLRQQSSILPDDPDDDIYHPAHRNMPR